MTKNISKKWSKSVTEQNNALDLEKGVFTWNDPERIAQSLLKSAYESHRRKGSPLQSAMSMLNFYINRAGKKLPQEKKEILEKTKEVMRSLYHKS